MNSAVSDGIQTFSLAEFELDALCGLFQLWVYVIFQQFSLYQEIPAHGLNNWSDWLTFTSNPTSVAQQYLISEVEWMPILLKSTTPLSQVPHLMTYRFLGRRAVHRHLLSSVHRDLSPMGRWHWSGSTGTAWRGWASQRYPGNFLHSPQSCSLWVNRKQQLLSPQFQSHCLC